MRGWIATIVAAACLLASACGDGEDRGGDTASVSAAPGERRDGSTVQDGIVVIDLQSSAPRYTDQLRLDVSASGDVINESSVFAVCTGLTDGDGPFRVGVTDLRRLRHDRPVLSVELQTPKRVLRPGEYDVEVLLIDDRQRQRELTGRITIDGDALRQGSFTLTDGRNTQVRGSFRCGEEPSDVTTSTSAPAAAKLSALRVRVVAGDGEGAQSGTMHADRKVLGDVDPADSRADAHCSGVVTPGTNRYVVRLVGDAAGDGSGRLRGFELVVRNARDADENDAQLDVRFGKDELGASGTVTFGSARISGEFRGRTESGLAVLASFRCGGN